MGDPKLPRRVWKKPKRPFNYDLKMEELKTLGQFGLRTKRELWKAHTELSRIRNQSRSLLALGQEVRKNKESILIKSLSRIGIVSEESTLDDILNLRVTDLLARRLQTIVMKNLKFRTPYQARQAVTHGHIMIGDRIVDKPSYTVTVQEENVIKFSPSSNMEKVLEKERIDNENKAQKEEQDLQDESGEGTPSGEAISPEVPKDENTSTEQDSAKEQAKGEITPEVPKDENTSTEQDSAKEQAQAKE